jgi:hypothetical protein
MRGRQAAPLSPPFHKAECAVLAVRGHGVRVTARSRNVAKERSAGGAWCEAAEGYDAFIRQDGRTLAVP